jgi:hypothetical protein
VVLCVPTPQWQAPCRVPAGCCSSRVCLRIHCILRVARARLARHVRLLFDTRKRPVVVGLTGHTPLIYLVRARASYLCLFASTLHSFGDHRRREETFMGKLRALRRRRVVAALLLTFVALGAVVATLFVNRHAVYRQVALQHVADQVAAGRDAESQALVLFDEILRIGGLDPGDVVIDDDPVGTLIRGWGYCDSIAMAFVQVAERIGFEGQLVFLQDPDTGTSPHTVATLKIDGEWRVFDVLYRGVSRGSDGSLSTVEDVASGRAPTTSPSVEAAWFEKVAIFYQTRPAETMRDRGKTMARQAVTLLPSWAMRLAQDAYLLGAPPTYTETNGQLWEDWQDDLDLDYWKARNYDMFGRLDRARPLYERLVGQAPISRHAASARVFLRQAMDPQTVPTHTTKQALREVG